MVQKIAVYDTRTRTLTPGAQGKLGNTHSMSFERMMSGLIHSGELLVNIDKEEITEIQITERGLQFIFERKS